MQLDTRSAIDGAIRGFQVAEGYYQRKADNERQAKLDERNEARYQDERSRLSQIEAKNEQRYQDEKAFRQAETEKPINVMKKALNEKMRIASSVIDYLIYRLMRRKVQKH